MHRGGRERGQWFGLGQLDTGRWIHSVRAAEGLGEGGTRGTAEAGWVQLSGQGSQCLRPGGDVETWQVCCGPGRVWGYCGRAGRESRRQFRPTGWERWRRGWWGKAAWDRGRVRRGGSDSSPEGCVGTRSCQGRGLHWLHPTTPGLPKETGL